MVLKGSASCLPYPSHSLNGTVGLKCGWQTREEQQTPALPASWTPAVLPTGLGSGNNCLMGFFHPMVPCIKNVQPIQPAVLVLCDIMGKKQLKIKMLYQAQKVSGCFLPPLSLFLGFALGFKSPLHRGSWGF